MDAGLSVFALLLAAAVAGGAAGFGAAWYRLENLQAELYRRPPVAIVDVTHLAVRLRETAPGDETATASRVTQTVQAAARRLADAGYVMLDAQAVLGAPEDLRVPEDSLHAAGTVAPTAP